MSRLLRRYSGRVPRWCLLILSAPLLLSPAAVGARQQGAPVSLKEYIYLGDRVIAVESIGGVPAAATALNATSISNERIDLTWVDNSTTESGFRVERQNGASWVTVGNNLAANTTSIQVTGLTQSTAYTFRVIAFNSLGDSVPSATATATTLPLAPQISSSHTGTSITLTWQDINPGNGESYKIYRKVGNGSWSTNPIATTAANATSYINSSLSYSTNYYYRVKATNAAGDSTSYSNEVSQTTDDQQLTGTVSFSPDWVEIPASYTMTVGGGAGRYVDIQYTVNGYYGESDWLPLDGNGSFTNYVDYDSLYAIGNYSITGVRYSGTSSWTNVTPAAGMTILAPQPTNLYWSPPAIVAPGCYYLIWEGGGVPAVDFVYAFGQGTGEVDGWDGHQNCVGATDTYAFGHYSVIAVKSSLRGDWISGIDVPFDIYPPQ